MRVLIIGCGASGAAAAIAAAEAGHKVTVLDKNRKPLKKLGVTGNGRCNLMNRLEPVLYGGTAFAKEVATRMDRHSIADFLTGLGLSLVTDESSRVYPSCFMASVVVDAFLTRMKELNVEILQNMEVTSIRPEKGGFAVEATESLYAPSTQKKSGKEKKGELLSQKSRHFSADRVILAAGGKAAPAHGTDGTAYRLAEVLGHSVLPQKPALCPLLTETEPIQGLEGCRVKAGLKLLNRQGDVLHHSDGEALFTAEGVSGIAAMQLARFVEDGCTLSMDMAPALTGLDSTALPGWMDQRLSKRGHLPPNRFLQGTGVPALLDAILRRAGLSGCTVPANTLGSAQRSALETAICDFRLSVSGVKGFEAAQVTAGGIATEEVSPATMESRIIPGLFITGEILDVDGDCGGHNLYFAFATGLLAGRCSE